MSIYKNTNGVLTPVKEKPFKLEREMQRVIESNLELVMGLILVKSEFTIKNKRIDTLAYDPISKAFVIIEFKRDRNNSVIDQGFAYLGLMLENRADFVLEYNENLKNNLKRDDVDWTQTRVVFVSTSFTDNQRDAANFKDLAIELWEVKPFENETISISQIKKSKAAESIKPVTTRNEELQKITKELEIYSEESNIKRCNEQMAELYEQFKESILNLADDIEIKPLKWYISFKRDGRSICDIEPQKQSLKMAINLKWGELDDPKGLARDVSNIGHTGSGDYLITITDSQNLEYLMSLVKQAIK